MPVDVSELVLTSEPDAVRSARRFAHDVLMDGSLLELADEAAMVVTELVTNALLHAGPPIVVRLAPLGGGVRIEVEDRGRTAPVPTRADGDAMTGRGLALVRAVASRWGAEPLPVGKVVWCDLEYGSVEIPADTDLDTDALLAAWVEPAGDRTLFEVTVPDVSTGLLLETRAHMANVVREFMLMSVGAASGSGPSIPANLAQLIETMVHGFAEARDSIKQQAFAAEARGQERTHLRLMLPAEAAAAGRAYLAALDQADSYARAGHLLTLESPAQHQVFRRWLVGSMISQLEAASRGEPPPSVRTFEQVLLDEFGAVAAAQRTSARAARLQAVTSALAAATGYAEVARIVVEEGRRVLGATGGGVFLLGLEPGQLTVPGSVGYSEGLLEHVRALGMGGDLPAASVLRTGDDVWLRSQLERDSRYPRLRDIEPSAASLCILPLKAGGRVLGALRFSFEEPRLFDDDERRFALALAAQTAQAFERSALDRAQREARTAAEALAGRLVRLQTVTAVLAGARDVQHVADIVVTHLADALGASTTSLAMVDGDVLRRVGVRGGTTDDAEPWQKVPLDALTPATQAVRTGEMVVVHGAADMAERYPGSLSRARGEWTLVCLPLTVRQRCLGAVSLTFPADHGVDDPAERRFLALLADTCAQALDRAAALTKAQEASERLALLAEASAELSETRGYRATLAGIAELIVPRLADWCSITVIEGGEFETVAITHIDPARVAWAEELLRRYPHDPLGETGVGDVLRTGTSELVPRITDEMLVAAAVDDEQLQIARDLQLSSALTVPLTGRAGTFGAIQLFYAESGRRYGEADRVMIEDLAHRAAVAVENARTFELQTARLASISRVAEVAQHAILAPIPTRVGRVQLAGAYVSASKDALIGGDLYEVVTRPGVVRLLIGDVRGKGLEAVRLATVVLGHFRAAAADHDDPVEVARQMDARLRPYVGDEDFVTALLVDVHDDGTCTLVCCGHPCPVLARDGQLAQVDCEPTVPLGLGVDPRPCTFGLESGDRLLMFTDGLIESRDAATGEFLELDDVALPLVSGELAGVLGNILARVQDAVGQRLTDDLALLAMEYDPQ